MRFAFLLILLFANPTFAGTASAQQHVHASVFAEEGTEHAVLAEARRRVEGHLYGLRQCMPSEERWTFQLSLDDEGRVTNIEYSIVGANRRCIERLLLRKLISRGVGPHVRVEVGVNHIRGDRGGGNGEGNGGGRVGGPSGPSHPRSGASGTGAGMTRGTLGRVRAGRSSVQGTMERSVVRRVVRRHLNSLRFCYERELHRRPDVEGTIIVRFSILPSGRVADVQTDRIDGGLETVAQCAARMARRWNFPAHQGAGLVVVTYPFIFSR